MQNILKKYNSFIFDSRAENIKNSVFFALQGERDGNNFAEEAFKKGAGFLILTKKPQFEINKENYIVVEDALKFASELAKEKFLHLKKNGIKTISLTGSIGKTTTKDFICFILQKSGFKTYGSKESFNNHIGLPFTILNAPEEVDFLVLEMGMNHKNEIAELVKIANTDIKIITNITNAHIGNFIDGRYGLAKAKGEILNESTGETIFITKSDLPFLEDITRSFAGNVRFINQIRDYKINQEETSFTIYDNKYIINKVVTLNWLSSLSFGFEILKILNIPFPQSISDFIIPNGRGNEVMLSSTCKLIDESYNASSESMINAICSIKLMTGKKLMVLGEMKELGEDSKNSHDKVFLEASKQQDLSIILIGNEFKKFSDANSKKVVWFENIATLLENFDIKSALDFNIILIKASHSTMLSKLVQKLILYKNTNE